MPRIAFFPDSFHEVNGVAHTARHFVDFAARHDLPMLCVRAGSGGAAQHGSISSLELPRSPLAVPLEQDLSFDPLFPRHLGRVRAALLAFRPDVIHITGPSELGLLGAWFAHRLSLPLAASWHTNVHEYAARRLQHRLRGRLPQLSRATEQLVLTATTRLYRQASVVYAPNPTLCTLLEQKTGRPCHLMQRGVDTERFTPAKIPSAVPKIENRPLLGYVGRLSVEKNVTQLPVVHQALRRMGIHPRWLIVGHGAEEPTLRHGLGEDATFTGVLRGEALATAYSSMDLLVFPSHTDTFGNVVLEALASGVPAVVTPDGGPASIVQHGRTGLIAGDTAFPAAIASLLSNPDQLHAMQQAARTYALGCSWDAVFRRVLAAYPVPTTPTVPPGS